jgi:hypothetical protein
VRKNNRTGNVAPARVVDMVLRWKESGLSQRAFCLRERIPEWQLSAWKRQVGDTGKISPSRSVQAPASVQFAPVTVVTGTEDDLAAPSAELASPPLKLPALDILVIRVPEGSSPSTIQQIVQAVTSRC